MRTIIAKTFSNSSSNSASSPIYHAKKGSNFQWMMLKKGDTNYKSRKDHGTNNSNLHRHDGYDDEEEEDAEILTLSASSSFEDDLVIATPANYQSGNNHSSPKKKTASSVASNAVSKLRSAVLTVMNNSRKSRQGGLGPCVTGTIFGRRRGHVHLAFQVGPKSAPALLIELDMPTNTLVREMSSGLVRIALECHRTPSHDKKKSSSSSGKKLLEEPVWRAYCNGKKCGFATRKECGPTDWRLLRAVEPVSVGAGVLPEEKANNSAENASKTGTGADNTEGDVMYMRAKFERVVGSKDSEAFYMLNPDGNGGPELSIYLLRV